MKQEGKAEASTAALKQMMKVNAKVRCNGERAEIPAEFIQRRRIASGKVEAPEW